MADASLNHPKRTVRDWEQGRAVPDRPAQMLLRVIDAEPELVRRVLATPSGE